jgi:hypothetical protein
MALMDRRQWVKHLAAAAASCFWRPVSAVALSPGGEPAYFPHYVDVAKQAGFN